MFGSKNNNDPSAAYERKLNILKSIIRNTEKLRATDPKSVGYLDGLRQALRVMQ